MGLAIALVFAATAAIALAVVVAMSLGRGPWAPRRPPGKALSARVAKGETNVHGRPLRACSGPGMATTGYTRRDGKCTMHAGDRGSHHVCIEGLNEPGEQSGANFCSITGQPNWCAEPSPCQGDPTTSCPKDKWCVCEWAFDRFVEDKGCDAFKVDCDATNELVLAHYARQGRDQALGCIQQQCQLPTPAE